MNTIHYLKIVAFAISIMLFTYCEKTNDVVPTLTCNLANPNIHPYAARYQRITDDLLQAGAPGVSITVLSPEGEWISSGGKADLANNVELSPCHSLRVGSITKIFTAVTIMKLQDEGILNINDKINKYIPESIIDEIENANDVTIEQLLNHTSGIKDYLGINCILGILNLSIVKNSAEENLKIIYGKKADFKPGEDLLYSNSNYLLLGLVIKYATDKSAYQVIRAKISEPLNMDNTFPGNEIPSSLTNGYYDTYDNGFVQNHTEMDNNAVGGDDMTDGGLISSSYNVEIFLNALFTGHILSEESLHQMQNFKDITQDLGEMDFIKRYGLGLMQLETENGTAIGHYGAVHCFEGVALYFPEQNVTLTILVNGYSSDVGKVLKSKSIFNYLFND